MKVNFSCKTFGLSSFAQASLFFYFCFAGEPSFKVKHVLFSLCECRIYQKISQKKKKIYVKLLLKFCQSCLEIFAAGILLDFIFPIQLPCGSFVEEILKITKIKLTKTFENNPFPCNRDMSQGFFRWRPDMNSCWCHWKYMLP